MKLMWKDTNISGFVTGVTWTGSAKQAARTVAFSVAYSPNDKKVKNLNIKLGDKIIFYPGYPDNKKVKFIGIVTQRERKSEIGELQYTATDGMMHLLRSSGTYRITNKTPEKITQMICRDVKVKTGSIAKTKIPISKIFFQERPYYEIIMAAYTKAYRKNKKKYIAQMNGDKLEVIQKGKIIPNFHIRQGERITDSSYTEDLESMVNRVYIYDSNNNKIGSVSNSNWIKKYGVFQNAISVDSGNGKAEAKAELQGINKTANLTMIGDYRCVSGLGVIIEDSRTGLKGKFWIENDSHEWSDGIYTTTLELAFKNVMDIQEEDQEQTANSAGGNSTTTSNALDDVLNQARAWIGISGSTNEATQYYGYNGVAWCCIFQWSVFNKSGHGDLFMGGGKTASCSEVTQWYQARGKFGTTPKVGALVVYGPGGGSHIGLVESVSGSGINDYVSIEGNTSGATGGLAARKQYGNRRSDVYGFCYIDYPVTTTTTGSGTAISGTTINIPSSVPQTGITGNYTCYPQFYGRWNAGTTQRRISEIWGQKGKTGSPENIATIDGYYLIAVTQKFGQVGDVVCVVLANGTRINCMIADEKNPGDSNYTEWGHDLGGGKADVIEWESMVYGFPNVDKWRGQRVTTIINGGRYQGL
ncbi:CHAP domain-containing protein [Blautia wexlerae]|jgi:hypothetical protein|uniref:CHAP domain-containing protein n=1 Tax=Blautia wexlerae TaxID=418240 RepID=UPI00189930FD|nr:CHAP domain-containing protein [Blautia wexlerae]